MTLLNDFNINWGEYEMYGRRQFLENKSIIYKQGEVGNGFYYLKKGLVKVVTKTAGRKDLLLKIVLPNQLVGIQAMDQLVHYTTAQTIEKSVLYFFHYDTIEKLMLEKPEMNHLFLQSVINEMNSLAVKISAEGLPAEQKLAILLLNIYDEFSQYNIPLLQKDIVSSTGLTRITIYKIFKEWTEKGYIEPTGKSLSIKNPSILKKYAKGLY
ncbi:Crp/Fnr family transcriptional regulator [Sporosarcina sp.]|uniref:Crp/Fnr family transcriptional regulator n=1 Tax=Sporosarcina sp. TaxID=49982 RepID=UPI002610CBC0|nr:Crp/Fnr family transcriptional regulator [Sporosarcina sp.]